MNRKFGWKKDKRDERDHLHKRRAVYLPQAVDHSPFLPSVRDQGSLGSCVGFGVGGVLTATANKVFTPSVQPMGGYEWFSPMWIYNGARLLEESLPWDEGCYPRDAYEWILEWGCLLEHFRPYHDTLDKTDPRTWLYNGVSVVPEAAKWPIVEYIRVVDSVEGIKDALASGFIVSIGTPWFAEWMSIPSSGLLPEVSLASGVVGGHETLLYGYDDSIEAFLGQNSWGTDWGKNGRFLMPYSSIEVFKAVDGYDAHYVKVNWSGTPPPPEPPKKKLPWWVWVLIGAAVIIGAIVVF